MPQPIDAQPQFTVIAKCARTCCPTLQHFGAEVKIEDDYNGAVWMTPEQFEKLYELYNSEKSASVQ